MPWRMDSTAGAHVWDTQPMSDEDLLCRDEQIAWLAQHERGSWGLVNGRIVESGDPTAYGTFVSVAAQPPPGTLANVTSLNGEASLWSTTLYTPWPTSSQLSAPAGWHLRASWQVTTSTSPGNLTLNPRIGSVAAGSSSAGAVALGAGAANALTASITTNWSYNGHLTLQSVGIPGTNSKAVGDFVCLGKPATTGTGAIGVFDQSGFTVASFDSSVASGFVLGMATTVTTITFAVQQIIWLSLF